MNQLSVEKLVDEQSLLLFKTGGDQKNFEIMNFVIGKEKTTVGNIMGHFDLTIMPANRRVNQLVSAGLMERNKGKKEVIVTKLGLEFVKIVELFRKNLIKEINQHYAK